MKKLWIAALVAGGCGGGSPKYDAPPGPKAERCALTTKTGLMLNASRELPDGYSEDEVFLAAQQFILQGGDIEMRDPATRSIRMKPFGGQTIESDCAVNQYPVFTLRITVVARTIRVNVDCVTSYGWEPGERHGVWRDRHREPLQACNVPPLAGEGDTKIPGMIADGALLIVETKHLQQR